MNNALLYIGGFFVCVLAALFAVPHFVDWNGYRGVFEEEASRVLGRDVRIGGAVNLRLLPSPYISLEKLKIADPSSETGESLFRAESFTLWLSVPPLLQGVLEADKIDVRRPVVRLIAAPEGGGNWQSLTLNAGAIPLVPKGISLQSVRITDGVLVVGTPARPEVARLEAINGDLSAQALTGPYKFAGSLDAGGAKRDISFATSAAEEGQDVRFKINARTVTTGDTQTVTGVISDLYGRPNVQGDLTAVVNVTLFGAAVTAPGGVPASDVTAKISGGVDGFELKDITISLQQSATPQLVTGTAKVSWPERTRIDVDLASRWLDLDRLSGGNTAVPLDIARMLFEAMVAGLPNEADTSAKAVFDQVTLGGEAVSDVRFAASRAGGALELKGLRASLPGGARVEFDGQVTGADATRAVAGTIALHGQSLQRFTAWGTGKTGLVNARAEGPFALEGELSLSAESFKVKDATAVIAGMPLSGALEATMQGRRRISLAVEGDRLDAGAVWPGSLSFDTVLRLLNRPGQDVAAPETGNGTASPDATPAVANALPDMDVRVRLRAIELVEGDRVLKDVDADLEIENGTLAMPKLKFTTADGLSVDLEGETVRRKAKSEGSDKLAVSANGLTGQVRGTISAPDGAAVTSLAAALSLIDPASTAPPALSSLAPLRMAGSVSFGRRTAQSADVQIDGVAGAARVSGHMMFDGGWQSWRTAPGQISVSADSSDIARTVEALIGSDAKTFAPDFGQAHAGRFQIKAMAGAGGGFLTNAKLLSEVLDARYDGTATFDAGAGWRTDGGVNISGSDARLALALAGIKTGKGIKNVPVSGIVKLTTDTRAHTFVMDGLQVGASKISGKVTLASAPAATEAAAATTAFDADLAVDTATVPALLAMLTTGVSAAAAIETPAPEEAALPTTRKRTTQQAEAEVPVAELAAPVWPTETFDTGLLAGLSGTLKAKFGTLSLEPGLGLGDAVLEASVTPAAIDVTRLEGKALGGATSATLSFAKDAAGTAFKGAFKVAAEGATGPAATITLEVAGRGASPAGLISDLKGKGELALAGAAVNVNAPGSLTPIADAALQGRGPSAGEDLELAVRAALKDASQPLGALTIPLLVADGVVRFDKVKIDAPLGRSQFNAVVELDTMQIDSEWQIEPKVQRAGNPAERMLIAPVTVVYTGKLRDLATLEPVVGLAGFERELSVRKMERDVEELERLRKLDQAQAKAEQERAKALEAERIKAAAAAKAARDAAAAASAAGLPPPGSPPAPAAAVLPLDTGSGPAPEAPAEPPGPGGAVSVQGEPLAGVSPALAAGAAAKTSNALGKPTYRAPRPAAVRKKPPVAEQKWQPFQVTPN